MFDVRDSLMPGFDAADERLQGAQNAVARANAGEAGRTGDAAMAQAAQSAIFSEALLNALHGRLEEIKSVTK